jgi:hydroxymethylpyrimidine pyrophosphatase-like HAD family hydrolase
VLAERPPEAFLTALRRHHVEPLATGEVIVATWRPHEKLALELIREMGLELAVTFNKGAVMILPAGITKATGLAIALDELQLAPDQVVGVGDAENDHVFLKSCGCSAVVSNAIPMLHREADVVMTKDHGAGVEELADALVATDLAQYQAHLNRRENRPVAVERRRARPGNPLPARS